MHTLTRPSLEKAESLGTLYDARTDTFVPLSLLRTQPPTSAVTKTDIPSSNVKYLRLDTFKEKFNHLDVGSQLGASFLAGFINVDGSGRYLTEKRDSNLVAQASLLFNITTVSETLNFQAKEIEECLALETLDTDAATHVVAAIVWGSRNIVTAKQTLSREDNAKSVKGRLKIQLSFLEKAKPSGGGEVGTIDEHQSFDGSFEVTVFGDVLADDGLVPTDLAGAFRFLSNVPKYVANANGGKGKPLTYTLLPIPLLAKVLKREIARSVTIQQLSAECSEKFVQVFDSIATTWQDLNDYRALLQDNRGYIPQDHIRTVGDRISKARTLETKLQSIYASALNDVRAGRADESSLWKVLEDFGSGDFKVHRLTAIISSPYREKVQFLENLVAQGAKYIGFNGESLDLELGSNPDVDIHVFHFSEAAKSNSELWKQNLSILYQLLGDRTRRLHIVLMDHDAVGERLDAPRITLMRNAEVITGDMLEERKISASKCITRYNDSYLDRSGYPKPLSRIIVKIPCPSAECSSIMRHDWLCAKCGALVEYGHVDQYLYCDCGRCEYRRWDFRCSDSKHGLNFSTYDEAKLLHLLKSLDPFEELNILILGPTGVGKSTWINAFVNYLTFPSLDDALDADKLCWIIPFAFRTYNVNERDEFEDIKVRVGFDDLLADELVAQKVSVDEHDGTTGESATQNTTVHRVQIGNSLVRLIDTPGIGDTRGASQDQRNMADILSVLRSYNKLHGILILLKPNEQKLTVMFRFCIQELLTHLHRDAAKNIAFGFTNTRGTNYMPGDTFDPLRAQLEKYKHVEISLRKHNVFCFDSESFRYLAAQKQHNKSLGHLEENRSSWEYSVMESKRLLNYFKHLPPHQVTSTVNLYETRHRIVRMTDPMAAIVEAIKSTINVNEDEIKELTQSERKKKDLEKMLKVQVNTLTAVRVDRPRTACSHTNCVEHANTGVEGLDGRPTLKTVYKTLCHNPCYLNGIKVDDVGNSGLKSCWAMNGGTCRICGHPWMSHLHINYELKEETKEIDDPDVKEALERNATFREMKQAAIAAKKRLVEQLEHELKLFRDAAAKFSIFLKRNAIMPYNDATLEYLDRHLEDERAKVLVGGSRDKLDRLTQYRKQYEQEVRTLEEYIDKGENHVLLDQTGVELLLQQLYSLKYYGKELRELRQVVDETQTVAHREKPYVMRAQQHFTDQGSHPEVSRKKSASGGFKANEKEAAESHSWGRWALRTITFNRFGNS
jgi:GTPase SAR1 family protein